MYGLVGVAMHVVVGVLVVASFSVIPLGWILVLVVLWLAGSVVGAAMWKRTVWVPLLASIFVSVIWMTTFFMNR